MSSSTARAYVIKSASLLLSQRWRWNLVTANGRDVANSGEGYRDRDFAAMMLYRVVTGYYADKPVEVYRTLSLRPSQRYAWRLVVNGRKVAGSGEGYTDNDEAKRMGNRVVSGAYDVEFVA